MSPRLNIEDDFWDDILVVAEKLGDKDRAIGMAVRFFKFAQSKHRKGSLITPEEFETHGFSEALIPIFAKHSQADPSKIQAVGAEKHFAWLHGKMLAGKAGGKAGSGRERDEKGRLLSKQTQAGSKHSQASSSYSSSYSSSSSFSSSPSKVLRIPPSEATRDDRETGELFPEGGKSGGELIQGKPPAVGSKRQTTPRGKVDPDGPSPVALAWRAYRDAVAQRHGFDPPWSSKIAGQLKMLTKRMPQEDVPEVVRYYVFTNDAFYLKSRHNVSLLLRDAEKLYLDWKNGRSITWSDAKAAETRQHNANVWGKFLTPEGDQNEN